jgi:hypothetical protein
MSKDEGAPGECPLGHLSHEPPLVACVPNLIIEYKDQARWASLERTISKKSDRFLGLDSVWESKAKVWAQGFCVRHQRYQ